MTASEMVAISSVRLLKMAMKDGQSSTCELKVGREILGRTAAGVLEVDG